VHTNLHVDGKKLARRRLEVDGQNQHLSDGPGCI
jgi:hypothetical protein